MMALALCLAVSLSLGAGDRPVLGGIENPTLNKAREHDEMLTRLKHDIFKVDRSIGETERLIAKSRNAPYLPDLQFRLAELYVEKSRYVYYLQAEQRPAEVKGALVSPETKLLKQKAMQLYFRLQREWPDFKDLDKVDFYLAHEQRELGQFEEMLKTLGELIRSHPKSPLRLEAEQIIGDHFFDKADLVEAEKHYLAILEAPPSPVHDLARYKMGWIRINQGKHGDAVPFFEAAAASQPLPGQDAAKALNIKREALLDLVYSYTESRPAKGAIQYFEKLSDSRATFALALDKLGNRYFIKQQYEFAIPALRKLMDVQPDPELDLERAEKLYDALKASKGRVPPKPADLHFLVRAAVEVKKDPAKDESTRKKQLTEIEELARDLATQMHVAAQKSDSKPLYVESADAYKIYLSLFRPAQFVRVIMRNRADALYAAREYPDAARQFEELATYDERAKDAKTYEGSLYGSLLAHFMTLKPGEVERFNAFEVADARQALKLSGALYVSKYPRSEHANEVKFNIARAFYDDGDFEKGAELFTAFAMQHPDYKDAAVAGNLALDSLRQVNDFKGIETTGQKFLSNGRLPGQFLAQVRKVLNESKSEALGELALKSSEETGDVVEGLIKVADQNKGQEIGEKALYGAFAAARDKRDIRKEREIGTRFAAEYTKSHYISDVLNTLGRNSAEAARFGEAAGYFEQLGARMGTDSTALEGWLAGARIRIALFEYRDAIRDLETATDVSGARKTEVLVLLAETRLKTHETAKARQTAELALKLDKTNATAASILAEIAAASPGERAEPLVKVLTAVTTGPNGQGEDSAKGLWFLGEMLFRQFKALPADKVEEKVAAIQQLEGVYTQASSMGSPEWAVASLWKLGLAYQHLADTVDATAVPKGLSAAENEQFRSAVKQQVQPLRDRSEDAFKACLSRAAQLEVFSTAVLGCHRKEDKVSSPVPGAQTPVPASPSFAELQRKAEATFSGAAFEALGQNYLEQRQVHLAHLTLARATELEDGRATAHNALGLAELYEGDPMGARAEYQKAIDSDPTLEKARANLAALRCRYGDVEGAKRELGLIKETAGLASADVDPEWKACR